MVEKSNAQSEHPGNVLENEDGVEKQRGAKTGSVGKGLNKISKKKIL